MGLFGDDDYYGKKVAKWQQALQGYQTQFGELQKEMGEKYEGLGPTLKGLMGGTWENPLAGGVSLSQLMQTYSPQAGGARIPTLQAFTGGKGERFRGGIGGLKGPGMTAMLDPEQLREAQSFQPLYQRGYRLQDLIKQAQAKLGSYTQRAQQQGGGWMGPLGGMLSAAAPLAMFIPGAGPFISAGMGALGGGMQAFA